MSQIFFDLDGPILDVAPKFYRIYTDLFAAHGQAVLSAQEYWECKRHKIPEPQIVAKTAPAEFAEVYIPERLKVIENIEYLQYDEIIEGAVAVLESLQKRHELVLVTLRNRRANLMWELKHFDLEKHFAAILTKENNHGDFQIKLELIRQYVGAAAASGMMVGDTESDVKAGQLLGLRTVAVTGGIRTKEFLQALGPDHIIDSMHQLLPIVGREFEQ